MSFFDLGSTKETHVSLETMRAWAGEVAAGYLASGVAPTETLVKIARQEELVPHQVELLAGESNKMIHQAKFASAQDKYLAADFPLCDSKAALAQLQVTGMPKIAGVVPDPVFTDHSPSGYELFGVEPQEMDKTASLKAEMNAAARKTTVLREKLAEEAVMAKYAAQQAEADFIKEARQEVLRNADNSGERMKILGVLDHFVKCAEVEDARRWLAKLAYVLGGEGLLDKHQVKTAMDYFLTKEASPVPESLISPTLKARVVNGTHPIYMILKTFKDHVARMNWARGNKSNVDDHLTIFRERISAL